MKDTKKYKKIFGIRQVFLFALVAGVSLAAGSVNGLTSLKTATVPGVPMPDPNWAKAKAVAIKAVVNAPLTQGLKAPGFPTIIRVSKDKIKLIINANGNTFATFFAIEETKTQKFVQADGSLGDKAVYRTFVQWGGDQGLAISMPGGTAYNFQVFPKTE